MTRRTHPHSGFTLLELLVGAALAGTEPVNPVALQYANRLSDYLFVLARVVNADGEGDRLWTPGVNR